SIRILVLLKVIRGEVSKILHPRAVIPIKVDNRTLTNETVASIASFFILYIIIFALGTMIVCLDGINFESAASSVAATLGDVGPGFGFVGPTQNYSQFSKWGKLLLSSFMLLGRLELFTIIALCMPKTWRVE